MGKTYFDILRKIDFELGGVEVGWADAASDSKNLHDAERYETPTFFDRGRIYITKTADGLAPQGEMGVIKASGNDTGEYELASGPFTADIENLDTYWIVPAFYTREQLELSINRVIEGLEVPEEDETSLVYDAEVNRYTLPVSIPDPDKLLQVHLQYSTDPKDWVEHTNWDTQEQGYLLIEGVSTPASYDGKAIRLVYSSTPSELSDYADELHKKIHQDIIIFGAAKRIIFINLRRAGEDATTDTRYIHFASQEETALKRHKINMPEKPLQSSGFGI